MPTPTPTVKQIQEQQEQKKSADRSVRQAEIENNLRIIFQDNHGCRRILSEDQLLKAEAMEKKIEQELSKMLIDIFKES